MSTSSSVNDGIGPERDSDRGIGEILLTALASTALVPFIQAIATKVGEDVYAKIRHLLRGSTERGSETSNGTVVLVDRRTSTILELPARLSEKDARALASVRMPRIPAGQWLEIRYDPSTRTWRATPVTEPPPDVIEVDDQR